MMIESNTVIYTMQVHVINLSFICFIFIFQLRRWYERQRGKNRKSSLCVVNSFQKIYLEKEK